MVEFDFCTMTMYQVSDSLDLMHKLEPEIAVTSEMPARAVESPKTHLFVATAPESAERQGVATGCIIGCASLCVFQSPTGQKASIEDVVVSSGSRRQGIGRALVEHIIVYARRELAPADLYLTSTPVRVVANETYWRLGFERKGTNLYRMRARLGNFRNYENY